MCYWPWSVSWTILKDPVRKAFLIIYHNLAEHLQEISDRAFKGIEADLPAVEEIAVSRRLDPVFVEFGVDTSVLQEKQSRHAK
jgi:hypothetical protein